MTSSSHNIIREPSLCYANEDVNSLSINKTTRGGSKKTGKEWSRTKQSGDTTHIVNSSLGSRTNMLRFAPAGYYCRRICKRGITLHFMFCRRCNTLYVLILRGSGHVSLSRRPRLHAQPSERDRTRARYHSRKPPFPQVCVRAVACTGDAAIGKHCKSRHVYVRVAESIRGCHPLLPHGIIVA